MLARLSAAVRSPRAFWGFAIAFPLLTGLGVAAVYLDGAWDLWEHLAAIRALADDPTGARHPMLAGSGASHLYTPYHLFWGLVMRWTGVGILTVASLAAAANAALFLGAAEALDRDLRGQGRDRLLIALVLLFGWLLPLRHSGVYGIGLWPPSAVFASAFAQPLAILVFSLAVHAPRRALSASAVWAAVGAGSAVVFLSHPPTGSFLALAFGVLALRWGAEARTLGLVGAGAVAAVVLVWWPLFPVVEAVSRSGRYAEMNFGGAPGLWQQGAWFRLLPGALGALYVAGRVRRKRLDSVSMLALASASVFLASVAAGGAVFAGRFVILLLFALHLATVLWLRARSPRVAGMVLVGLAVLALPEAGASIRRLGAVRDVAMRTRLGAHTHAARQQWLLGLLPGLKPADVVLAPADVSWWLPALTGARVAVVEHADPFLRDYRARRDEAEAFFEAPATEALRRRRVLARRDVRFVLVPDSAWARVAPALAGGTVVAASGGYRSVRVRPSP